jgi:cobalt/nickel transport system permease protein
MHIPDGFLSAPVSLACAALAAAGVGAAATRARADQASSGPRGVALIGVTAAFVFAAQLVNFPVAGGTSGHLVGGVLAAVLLGPSAAVVVMTAVLALQCLVFGDGGLLALGANVVNMGLVHPVVGFAVYRLVAGRADSCGQEARRIAGAAFASWVATVAAAATCAGELALSRVGASAVVLPAMVGVHALIGLGEATITALVLATVLRLRPELLERARRGGVRAHAGSIALLGLSAASAIALFVSPFACRWPDGLERIVGRLGVEPSRALVSAPAPLRDYTVPRLGGPTLTTLATSAAALVGTLLVFGLCVAIGLWLAPRPARAAPRPARADAVATRPSRS